MKFIKCVSVLGLVLVGFLLEPVTGLSAPYVSVIGAAVLKTCIFCLTCQLVLLLCTPKDITGTLEKVEWPTLLFFAYLFIFIRLSEKLDLTYTLTHIAEDLIAGNADW